MLAVIPLVGGLQVRGLHTLPGRWGQQFAASGRTLSGAVVHAQLWSLRWQWWLEPGPRAHVGGALIPESACVDKEAPMAVPPLSLWAPQQRCPSSLVGPGLLPYSLGCGAAHPSPLRLSPCSQSSPLPGSDQTSAPSPSLLQWRSSSGWRVPGSGTYLLCRSLSTFPSTNWLLYSPLRL